MRNVSALISEPGVRSLRELAYPDVHVVIFCFSVVQPETLWALRDRWLPELASSGLNLNPTALETAVRIGCLPHQPSNTPRKPGPAFILVGCACDLRNDIKRLLDLSARNELPVNDAVAQKLAVEFGAEAYIECSALTQKQLKKVFDLAVWYGLQAKQAMQNSTNANTLSSGSNGRNSSFTSSSRKSKRRRENSSLQATDRPQGVFDLAVWYGLQAKQAMQNSTNANTLSSGSNGRNSSFTSSSRKSKRRRENSSLQATDRPQGVITNNGSLSGSQRSIWKKLLCLR
nr:Rho GTP binding protein RhoU [Hymenolepis microstoma]